MHIEGFNNFMPMESQASKGPSQKREEAELKKACEQFEEMFLNQMLSQMRKTSGSGGLFEDSQQKKMYEGMMDQERAKIWSQDGGVGLGNMLFQQMKDSM